jgi:hypothetical protein
MYAARLGIGNLGAYYWGGIENTSTKAYFSIFSMGTTTMRVSQTHSKCEEFGLFNYFSTTFFKGWVDEIDILMIVFI